VTFLEERHFPWTRSVVVICPNPHRTPALSTVYFLLGALAWAGCQGGETSHQSADATVNEEDDAEAPRPDKATASHPDRATDLRAAEPDAGADEGSGTADAGQPYVRADGGPFGIAARPAHQTCKPPADPEQPTAMLSATGCVDPTDPTKPAASLIPYDVNSPLWSDGADKQRFMAIPDGALVHVKDCKREPALCKPTSEGGTTDDEGHFEFPLGTVLVKNFLFNKKLLETRLFVHHMDGMWRGYSYQWNDAQTDATIVDQYGVNKPITNAGKPQSWYFPSRTDCNECHNDTVGGSLGPETIQLDKAFKYPSGITANQLDTLEHIGVLDAPITRLPPLVDPRVADPTGKDLVPRVRSYLHANCAICHRPEGLYSSIDLRDSVPFAAMNICNVAPNKGDLGVMGPKRLAPNDLTRSIILLRMQAPDKLRGRMPQLASSVLDPIGIGLVTSWIKSITTCP
jgi:uncharacterized repeat protein (TIGR03806 family)